MDGLDGSDIDTCLKMEAVTLPALYLFHSLDLLCSLVFISRFCACSDVTLRELKTASHCSMRSLNGRSIFSALKYEDINGGKVDKRIVGTNAPE